MERRGFIGSLLAGFAAVRLPQPAATTTRPPATIETTTIDVLYRANTPVQAGNLVSLEGSGLRLWRAGVRPIGIALTDARPGENATVRIYGPYPG